MKLAEDLKKAVLQAAMQGKLTKQLETDSSVDELLKKIAEEKEKLIEEEKIRKEKPVPHLDIENLSFELPSSWKWVQMNDVFYKITDGTHKTPKYTSTGIPFVSVKNCSSGVLDLSNTKFISEKEHNELYSRCNPEKGDLLITKVGTTGVPVKIDTDIVFDLFVSVALLKFSHNLLNIDYLYYALQSPDVYEQVKLNTKGIGNKNWVLDDIKATVFPLPPIEEQQRIVEKLNQILPLIDEYGKEEDELIALCQNFPEEMKKSVLQAAMQGKLTKQLETDSSVDELLKKIAEEKATLISEGKIKKEKPLAEITEDEIPFEIPENWRWEKLQRISTYGQPKKKKTSSELTDSDWVLDLEDIERDTGRILNKASIKTRDISGEKIVFAKNDILYSKLRPYLKKNLVAPDNGVCTSEIVPFNTFGNICNEFINQYLRSPFVDSYINSVTYGMKMPRVGTDTMLNLIVPLPPIEEQKRIVEKLNTILPIIDSMAVYGTKKKAGRPKQEEALAFISSLLGTNKSTDSRTVTPEILELTAKAKEELPAIVKKYASLMGVNYNRITIRHQKTRWGSCTKTGNLSFNCLLMKMPENVRDYVIIHELAHRKELNHSTKFWAIVAEYCPWYKEAKQWLKENGENLFLL